MITKMTSWAVCGVRGNDKQSSHNLKSDPSPESPSDHDKTSTQLQTLSGVAMATDHTHHPPSYHPHPRESVGLVSKRLLDLARLHYLRERGMEARLVYFVPRGTSLENVLLIATPTNAA